MFFFQIEEYVELELLAEFERLLYSTYSSIWQKKHFWSDNRFISYFQAPIDENEYDPVQGQIFKQKNDIHHNLWFINNALISLNVSQSSHENQFIFTLL